MSKFALVNRIKKIGMLQVIDDSFGNIFSYFRYKWCLFTDRVYFGSYLAAKQGQAVRHCFMQKLVEEYSQQVRDKIAILEIGSWAGGSAITWADAIKKYNSFGGIVLCIDQWISYFSSNNKLWVCRTMEKALKTNRIYNLFLHNIRASKYDDIVFTFKGSSSQNLGLLKNNQFDIIFVDGDHLYESVYSDIEKSVVLLKEGGVICGDDLELQYPSVCKDNLEKAIGINIDVDVDHITKKRYHPGVTKAVWKYFKTEVSSWEGFWAMKKKNNSWESVALNPDKKIGTIPRHLR